MKFSVLFFLLINGNLILCQSSFYQKADSLNSKRVISVSSGIAATWAVSTIGFYNVWYADFPSSKFHFFNDSKEWLQMDKVGHFYSANKLSMATSNLFRWSGMKSSAASIVGGCVGLGLQTTLEIMDGTSAEWGFSWGDMTANALGTFSYTSQQLIWDEQRILVKFSAHPTSYASLRPSVLGSTFSERLLKDYNGQTYWLSINAASFLKSTKIPKWLCLSIGYGIDQKIVGDKEVYYSDITKMTYHSKRKMLFSLDVDFSKLPIRRVWLKTLVKQFNYVKIPFPTLIWMNGKIAGAGIYF